MNCYKCKYGLSTPGDNNISCKHPEVGEYCDIKKLMHSISSGDSKMSDLMSKFEFKIQEEGIDRREFVWPAYFDPIWMIGMCKGFTKK